MSIFNSILAFIIFLSFAQLSNSSTISQKEDTNSQNLLVQLDCSAFQGFIKIEFALLNDSFSDNFDLNLIEVQINSATYMEKRYYKDLQQTTVVVGIQLKDAFKDLVIKVIAKGSLLNTRANKKLNNDFSEEIFLATQLPQLISLDLSQPIKVMQNSSWMDFLRIFPIYLIFFNSAQGIYVIILAEIKLPQRLYEIIRLLSCFYFKNLRGWNVSQDYPYNLPQGSIFGVDIYSSDLNVYLSQIGISENVFAQIFLNIIILIFFWLVFYFSSKKQNQKLTFIMGNVISLYHKLTLLLFLIVLFSQIRLVYTLQSSAFSVISFMIGISMLIYMIYNIQFILRKLMNDDKNKEEQAHNQKSTQEIIDLLQFYFSSYNQKDCLKNLNNQKKINNFFPLISFFFKVYTTAILVFMQQTKQGQISIIIISYFFYMLFSYRYFIIDSRYIKTLKTLSQISFFLLLIFTLANYLVIEDLINDLPQNKGEQISEQKISAINGLEVVQLIFMFMYMLFELMAKLFQMKILLQKTKKCMQLQEINDKFMDDSQIQIQQNFLVQILNGQNSKINKKMIDQQQMNEFYRTNKSKDSESFPSYFQNQLSGSITTSFKKKQSKTSETPKFACQRADSKSSQTVNETQRNMNEVNDINIQKKEEFFSHTNSLYEINQEPTVQENKQNLEPQKENQVNIELSDNKNKVTQYNIKINKVDEIQFEQSHINNQFLYAPTLVKKILKNNSNTKEKIKDADKIDNYVDKKASFDESDLELFSSLSNNIQDELMNNINIHQETKKQEKSKQIQQLQQNDYDIDQVQKQEEFNQIMKAPLKVQEISRYMKKFISFLIDKKNQFLEAKNPYCILLYQDVIQQLKDNEGQTEYTISSLYLREANIRMYNQDNKSSKTIFPVYRQRVFSINNHNQERFRELEEIFKIQYSKKKQNGLQIQQNTRLFFDLDSYEINTKLNHNSHLRYSYTFDYNPYYS